MPPVNRPRPGQASQPQTPKKSSGSNKGILWIVVVIVVLGLAAAGYFFGYPLFQKYWDARFGNIVLESPPVADTTTVITPEVEEVFVQPEVSAIPKGYYIIVGSFRNKDNADKLVQTTTSDSEVKALYFEDLGLYRVSVGYFDNIHKAYNNIHRIKDSYGVADAWVLDNR